MRRFGSGSRSATASRRSASSSRSAASRGSSSTRPSSSRAGRGASSSRRRATTARSRSSRARASRSSRSRWTTRASTPTRSTPSCGAAADPPSFLYTIPTFQNPSGRTLSAERRARLVEIVREHELAGPRGRPVRPRALRGQPRQPSLLELEGGELVTYTSSFSKTVAPGRAHRLLRPARRATRPAFEERAVSTYISPPFLPQAIVCGVRRAAVASSRTSSACAASCARGATRCSTRSTRTRPARLVVEPARGRLLRLARPRRRRHGRARGARRSGRASRSSPGAGFFPRGSGLGASAARASPSATRRRSGSPRASSARCAS